MSEQTILPQMTIGSDPEFFLVNKNGEFKSAIGVVQGTKENKIDLGNGNRLFYDNVLAEVNICPGTSAEQFIEHLTKCFLKLAKAVYPYQLKLQSSTTFPAAECKHPDAMRFGCNPEFCAYALSIIEPPEVKNTFRSAGGHIHLGSNVEGWPLLAPVTQEDSTKRDLGRLWVVRMLDLFLGIPSLWLDQDPTSAARRKLYGKAGSHRPQDWGVEYRALSNFWLRSPQTVRLVYQICKFVVDFVATERHKELWEVYNGDFSRDTAKYDVTGMRAAIDSTDKNKAKPFLNGLVKKYMPAKLFDDIMLNCEPPNGNLYIEWGLN